MGHRVTTLNVNAIEPAGSTLTIGASGDTVVATDSVNVNTVKDAGGNTLWVSNGSGTLSSVNSGFGGKFVLISSQTASDSASISFTSGIDSTYREYIFKFYTIRPATDAAEFSFQVNESGETGYNETISSTTFYADHAEDNTAAALQYTATHDQGSGTSFQPIAWDVGNGADECCAGELRLFNPGSTSLFKNFYARLADYANGLYMYDDFTAGIIGNSDAITQIQFKFSTGNIADGTIMMYGVSIS